METQIPENRIVSDLKDRRLVQYVGAYIALGFGIVQFAMLAEERYNWPGSLVDKLVIFLVVLLPAIIVFTYNHGKPGPDDWKPFEKVFIPLNVIVALITALFSFNHAAPQTERVTVVNDEGAEVEHVIPSQEYSKRITVLPFTRGEEVDLDDSQIISYLISLDINQDSRIYANHLFELKEDLLSYDLDFETDITQSKAVRIARDKLSDYFITGDLSQSDNGYQFSPKVFDTNRGEVFYEATIQGETIYELVDEFTSVLNDKLYPDENSEFAFTDLPAYEIISPNKDVVKAYVQSLYVTTMNPQLMPNALELMTTAIEKDESCALCYEQLSGIQTSLNIDGAVDTYAKALEYADALPENTQYRLKVNNYAYKQEPEKSLMLAERWMTLYPSEYTPYYTLYNYHLRGFRIDEAKKICEKALEYGHKAMLLQLADLQILSNELDEAKESIQEYGELFPHKANELLTLGDVYLKQGKIQEAIDHFETILISNPKNISAAVKTADACSRLGEIEKELDILSEALKVAKTYADSIDIYNGFKSHYVRFGNEEMFMNTVRFQNKLNESRYPPVAIKMFDINFNTIHYINFDKIDYITGLFDEAIGMVDSSQKGSLECIKKFNLSLHTENLVQMDESMNDCGEYIKASMGKGGEFQIEGFRAAMNQDYDGAINAFDRLANASGVEPDQLWQVTIKYYHKGKQFAEGLEMIDKVLVRNPASPLANYYKGLFLFDLNRVDDAKNYLEKALEAWEGSSPNYKYYKEAVALSGQMS